MLLLKSSIMTKVSPLLCGPEKLEYEILLYDNTVKMKIQVRSLCLTKVCSAGNGVIFKYNIIGIKTYCFYMVMIKKTLLAFSKTGYTSPLTYCEV